MKSIITLALTLALTTAGHLALADEIVAETTDTTAGAPWE